MAFKNRHCAYHGPVNQGFGKVICKTQQHPMIMIKPKRLGKQERENQRREIQLQNQYQLSYDDANNVPTNAPTSVQTTNATYTHQENTSNHPNAVSTQPQTYDQSFANTNMYNTKYPVLPPIDDEIRVNMASEEMIDFFVQLNLQHCIVLLVTDGFEDMDTLVEIDDQQLKQYGIVTGHRIKILKALKKLKKDKKKQKKKHKGKKKTKNRKRKRYSDSCIGDSD